jgi:hypothetical protein
MGLMLAVVLMCVLGGCFYATRRFRDPRLNRDWSDDEPAPYDSPRGPQMFENVGKFGSDNMGAYERMLDEPKPRDY